MILLDTDHTTFLKYPVERNRCAVEAASGACLPIPALLASKARRSLPDSTHGRPAPPSHTPLAGSR